MAAAEALYGLGQRLVESASQSYPDISYASKMRGAGEVAGAYFKATVTFELALRDASRSLSAT